MDNEIKKPIMEPLKPLDAKPLEPMSLSMVERLEKNYLIQAWLVLILSLFFGASLAGIDVTLSPKIEENKINETREKVPELILGSQKAQQEKLNVKPHVLSVDKNGRKILYSAYEASYLNNNALAGWVVKASGQGYADKIELLVGFDSKIEKITGLFILSQKETPGLGNKIVSEEWRGQFINKEIKSPLNLVKRGAKGLSEIDAISGATISSKSTTNIVNTVIADVRSLLLEKSNIK